MAGRRVLSLLHREIRGLHEAAYLLALFTLGSQVFALIRDRLLAHSFGAGETLDVFYAAFRIPDVLYALLASLVSLFVLIPFIERTQKEGKAAVQDFLSDMVSFFSGLLVVLGLVALIFTPQLVEFLYGGFTESMKESLVLLVRILLLQPLFLGVSNLFAAYVQIQGRFLLYAIAPILYNIGIIIGIVVLYPLMGIAGLAWGVVLGAVFHLCVQAPFIASSGVWPRLQMPNWKRVSEVVRISIPRTITLSAQQFVMLALISMASLFAVGSVSSFSLAWNLQAVPLAIIGASFSVAAFPKLARLFGAGEREAYRNLIVLAARQIIFWAVPATVLMVVLRAQIVRVVFGTGAFDWDATMLTGAVLALLVISLVAQSLVVLLVRACYAAGKTMVPLVLNVGTALVTVAGAWVMVQAVQAGALELGWFVDVLDIEGVAGQEVLLIALAYSAGSVINMLLLFGYFEIAFHRVVPAILRTCVDAVVASLVAGAVAYGALNILSLYVDQKAFSGVLLWGLGAGLLGVFAWFLALVVLGSKDLTDAWAALHQRLTRSRVGEARGSIGEG